MSHNINYNLLDTSISKKVKHPPSCIGTYIAFCSNAYNLYNTNIAPVVNLG